MNSVGAWDTGGALVGHWGALVGQWWDSGGTVVGQWWDSGGAPIRSGMASGGYILHFPSYILHQKETFCCKDKVGRQCGAIVIYESSGEVN